MKPASDRHASPSVCVLLLFTRGQKWVGLPRFFPPITSQHSRNKHPPHSVFCCVLSFVVYTTQQAIAKQHLSLSLSFFPRVFQSSKSPCRLIARESQAAKHCKKRANKEASFPLPPSSPISFLSVSPSHICVCVYCAPSKQLYTKLVLVFPWKKTLVFSPSENTQRYFHLCTCVRVCVCVCVCFCVWLHAI